MVLPPAPLRCAHIPIRICLLALSLWLLIHAAQVTTQHQQRRRTWWQAPRTHATSAFTLPMPPPMGARAHPPGTVDCDTLFLWLDIFACVVACGIWLRFGLRLGPTARRESIGTFRAGGLALAVPPYVISGAHTPHHVCILALSLRPNIHTCGITVTAATCNRRPRRRGLHCRCPHCRGRQRRCGHYGRWGSGHNGR